MSDNKGLACLGVVFISVVAIVVGSILNGYVLAQLWGWFVVPTFGSPALGIVPAMGISLIASMLTHRPSQTSDKKKDWSDILGELFASAIFSPLVVLFFGYIINSFMPV